LLLCQSEGVGGENIRESTSPTEYEKKGRECCAKRGETIEKNTTGANVAKKKNRALVKRKDIKKQVREKQKGAKTGQKRRLTRE